MSTFRDIDLGSLQRVWSTRRAALTLILRRFDTQGMSRPARDPDERKWMNARPGGPFIEDETIAAAARAYYSRRYSRENS